MVAKRYMSVDKSSKKQCERLKWDTTNDVQLPNRHGGLRSDVSETHGRATTTGLCTSLVVGTVLMLEPYHLSTGEMLGGQGAIDCLLS